MTFLWATRTCLRRPICLPMRKDCFRCNSPALLYLFSLSDCQVKETHFWPKEKEIDHVWHLSSGNIFFTLNINWGLHFSGANICFRSHFQRKINDAIELVRASVWATSKEKERTDEIVVIDLKSLACITMHPSRIEEKAALLLAEADDDEDQELDTSSPVKPNHEHIPMVSKRPKSSHSHPRHRSRPTGSHPVLCFALIMGAFILGCVSGVVIMLYRMSQDAPQGQPSSSPLNLDVDLSIRTKLAQSMSKSHFLNINR